MFRFVPTAAICFALIGCMGTPPVGESSAIQVVQEITLPMPGGIGASGSGNAIAVLGPFDKVSIEPFGLPDLQREVVLDGEGMISYPLAGRIHAGGLTTSQLAGVIEAAMRERSVRDPQVSVNVAEYKSKSIAVDGQVNRPGVYPVQREMTLIEAVATAGGTSELARTSDVLVFRNVDGQEYVGLYNLAGIRRGNYQDPVILPDDRIVVSSSRARALMESLQGVTSLITTPLILLIRG